jgi:gliding motility-associated-like protein
LFDRNSSIPVLLRYLIGRIGIFLFFISLNVQAQVNLVPNPSFENYINCPTYISEFYQCSDWFTATRGTPDYFNSCFVGFNNSMPDVPINYWGTQNAHSGNAYAGFAVKYVAERREYISCKLNDSLSEGKKYCFEFYLSLSDSSRYGIDQIGLYLSNTNDTLYLDTINFGGFGGVLEYAPIFQTNTIITDTASWTKVSGTFIANGGEQYLMIGCFVRDSLQNSDSIQSAGYAFTSYYYIDDVSLYECPDIPPDSTSTITIPNAFSPNGDGINDLFSPEAENLKSYSCTIFNRWGNQVFNSDEVSRSWDGKYNGCESPEGVYYYIIEANGLDGKQYRQSGFVMLMR